MHLLLYCCGVRSKAEPEPWCCTSPWLKPSVLHQVMEEQALKSRYEELGVELYNAQQELAKVQATLKTRQEDREKAMSNRRQVQEELENTRKEYNSMAEEIREERAQCETRWCVKRNFYFLLLLVCLFNVCDGSQCQSCSPRRTVSLGVCSTCRKCPRTCMQKSPLWEPPRTRRTRRNDKQKNRNTNRCFVLLHF